MSELARRPFVVALALSLLASSACGSCKTDDASSNEVDAAAFAAEPPVPMPEGLVAEATLLDPNPFWGKLQKGVGGALGILPMTLGGLVCAFAGIDPSLGPEIDGTAPAYGVVAEGGGPGEASWAVAVKLVEPHKAKILLVESENARYQAKTERGMTVLTSKGLPLHAALALGNGGWLIVARNPDDLLRLGPYVHRTLPTRPRAKSSLLIESPRAALTGPLKTSLSHVWTDFRADKEKDDAKLREAHGGRAPDFGDPKAILDIVDGRVQDYLAIIGDLESAKIAVDAGEDDLRAMVTMTPAAGGGRATQMVKSMRPGDAAPLLDVAGDASIALFTRDDAEERKSTAKRVEDAIGQTLGERLPEVDRKKLHGVLDGWSTARGDWLTAAYVGGKPRGLLAGTPTAEGAGDTASRSLREGVELLQRPAFKGPLEAFLHVKEITLGTTDVPTLGKAQLATFVRAPEKSDKSGTPPSKIGGAWLVKDGRLTMVVSEEAPAFLGATAAQTRKLGDDPRLATAVHALGNDVTFAFVSRPVALGITTSGSPAPVLIATGRQASAPEIAFARVEVADVIVREAIKMSGGF
ncbi:MAG: hypothetical protein JWM74_4045 [Myxococcaceae bacterium]|nr:hypothetical protein [Myxococcaceae bacterium]